jgi:hypothetical protein|nr:MAG TPA: hypothetical protein [Caudoviricetes sp.]
MEQKLEEKATDLLVKMIDVTIQSVSDVVAFGKQQIPDIINQLLMWKIAESGVWLLFGIVFLCVGMFFSNHYYNRLEELEEGLGMAARIVGSIISILAGSIMIVSNLLDVLYIWLAPKVWLIEYGAELVKK